MEQFVWRTQNNMMEGMPHSVALSLRLLCYIDLNCFCFGLLKSFYCHTSLVKARSNLHAKIGPNIVRFLLCHNNYGQLKRYFLLSILDGQINPGKMCQSSNHWFPWGFAKTANIYKEGEKGAYRPNIEHASVVPTSSFISLQTLYPLYRSSRLW